MQHTTTPRGLVIVLRARSVLVLRSQPDKLITVLRVPRWRRLRATWTRRALHSLLQRLHRVRWSQGGMRYQGGRVRIMLEHYSAR